MLLPRFLQKTQSKLLISQFFVCCLVPADKAYRERALLNETDIGFVSREFFQIKVEVPMSLDETPIRDQRAKCKRDAYSKALDLSMPFLIDAKERTYSELIGFEKYLTTKQGKERTARSPNPQSSLQSLGRPTTSESQTSSVANPFAPKPQETDGMEEDEETISKEKLYLTTFGWFFEEMKLYKEDYTQKGKCTFLYRRIEENLYEKVENTEVPIEFFERSERTR